MSIYDSMEITRDQIVLTRDQIVLTRDQIVLTRDLIVLTRDQIVHTRDQIVLTSTDVVQFIEYFCAIHVSFKLTTIRYICLLLCLFFTEITSILLYVIIWRIQIIIINIFTFVFLFRYLNNCFIIPAEWILFIYLKI